MAGTEKFSAGAGTSRRMMLRRHCRTVHFGIRISEAATRKCFWLISFFVALV